MEATVRANCPQCQSALRIPAKWVGQAVKCKKCGATVRVKAKGDTPTAGTVPAVQPIPINKLPSEPEDSIFGLPGPIPPSAPQPAVLPQLDANGYPLPAPPGYPYAPPAAYPYPTPPGYPAPAPAAAYPYPAPPGYPQPGQPGYVPPAGYALPPGYAPPPGHPYPQPLGVPGTTPIPMPTADGAQAVPAAVPSPFQPSKPGAKAAGPKANMPAAPVGPGANAAFPPPVPGENEFQVDTTADTPISARARNRYRRRSNSGKFIWIVLCLFLTAGLVAGGIVLTKRFNPNLATNDKPDDSANAKGGSNQGGGTKPTTTAYPRRLLFISISKYMYLNPLTASRDGIDLTKPAAQRLAYDWRVPTDPNNNQLFVLSDTLAGAEARLPMKEVVEKSYQEFFNSSRAQDRIVIYFGGHALEKNGKAYIAPMEAEPEGEDGTKSLIPLDNFYQELQKSKAAQKVVIWDVCRYNAEKGRVRPGSEPMSAELYKALSSPPAGIQAVITCKPGENAMEFTALRPDGFSGAVYSGSSFLESMKFVAEPRNQRMPKSATATAADPLPVVAWAPVIAKRTVEMSEMAEKSGSGGKQTIALTGTAPADLTAPNGEEAVAIHFELPPSPKGASQADIQAVEREFYLPPLKPGLATINLADFPFPTNVMKDYMGDGVSLNDIMSDKEKYRLRVNVLDAFAKIREKWLPGAGATMIRESVKGPINDAIKGEVRKEQEFWAVGIIELENVLQNLKDVEELRAAEPKRWQAHYDFAVASVKARLAYMNEYNKLLGNLITESLPTLDPKIGQDGYALVASETLKSSKDIKKMAEEARDQFQDIATKYKGTPWAIQAKQEKSVVIGLNWKVASLETEKK